MSASDLQLNCGIRSVLSRHWIDLTKTSFYARRGHVHMTGEVQVVGARKGGQETADVLRAFELELKRLQAVRSVSFEFTNWVRDGAGVWICLDKKTPSPPPGPAAGGRAVPTERREP